MFPANPQSGIPTGPDGRITHARPCPSVTSVVGPRAGCRRGPSRRYLHGARRLETSQTGRLRPARTLQSCRAERRSRQRSGARPVPRSQRQHRRRVLRLCGVVAGAAPLRVGTARAPKSSRRARVFPGVRLCARSTSRSRSAAREASGCNVRPRRFRAAATGPRRTQARSLGCGSAAL